MVSLDHSASSLSFYLDYLSLFLADESLSIDAQKDEIAADNSDVSKTFVLSSGKACGKALAGESFL